MDEEKRKQQEYDDYQLGLASEYFEQIKNAIKSNKDAIVFYKLIPSHLYDYVERSFERWIEIAYTAKYLYTENVEYKLVDIEVRGERVIVPVDNENTGVSMENTILSNGLHQFLQLKHGLHLTYEHLTSSMISNVAYVKNYKSNIFGLTGTLGSNAESDLLSEIFNVQFSKIPTYKLKKFTLYPGRVFANDVFNNRVAIAALGETFRSRAVLIICASIKHVSEIEYEIKMQAQSANIHPTILIYRDERDKEVTNKTIDPNCIIIATNISGRGTDLKTSDLLESNGGLHVILAFLACNQRVEDQAMGRTSRQGKCGSGQNLISENDITHMQLSENNGIRFLILFIFRANGRTLTAFLEFFRTWSQNSHLVF